MAPVTPYPETAAVMECFPEPMILIDAEYRILAANEAYRREYGGSRATLCGRRCFEISHKFDVPCSQAGELCPMERSRESGEPQRVLHLHHTPRGEEHVDVETYPVRDAGGEVRHFLELIRKPHAAVKVTEQKAVGRSPAFTRMLELIQRVAPSESSVMLLGESGTGKEVAARMIHEASRRAEGPFVPVECSGLTESLFESELFGHEKGAFTGAHSRKMGLVESARGGTLFLDEVGDIPLNLQVKLLRLLETGSYRPVGSVEAQRADFRLVCATHRDLEGMVERREFRQDLFFRLNVFPIDLPALRERLEDLPQLVENLLQRAAPGRPLRLAEESLALLARHPFRGNIRELRNILERASLLADGELILPRHLPGVGGGGEGGEGAVRFRELLSLEELEHRYLLWAAATYKGSKRELAERLGLGERTFYRRLEGLKGEG